ncbi:MAG: DMT family transporter [Desulfobulbaceae bacterium]|nr:MAG: DMT family transporter [Desulfobulbaceae bacterium]
MKNFLFYVMTVLIWGSTWIGIKLQLGVVDPMVSVAYRFALAAMILILWCWVRKLPMRFTAREHGFIFCQGLLLFGFNYLFFYIAELYLASGLAAVIFSTILVMNVINGRLFLGAPVNGRVVFGGFLGLIGIILVFKPEISGFSFSDESMKGVILCLLATFLASLGNIISARNQRAGLPIVQTNGYGMAYGAAAMFAAVIIFGKSLSFDFSPVYIGSLLYLALFGSVIAFGCYLTLVGNIGADRAAYATLLFPIVALGISTIWESYQWSVSSITGVSLILAGNFWMLKKTRIPNSENLLKRSVKRMVQHLQRLRLRRV